MKNILLICILAISSNTFASPENPFADVTLSPEFLSTLAQAPSEEPVQPKVSCHLYYNKVDGEGISRDSKNLGSVDVTKEGAQLVRNGFEFYARLRQVCASDGGSCFGYDLVVKIKRDHAESYFSTAVEPLREDEMSRRHSASLDYGRERLHVNCDVKR